jgi:hypothetical protein
MADEVAATLTATIGDEAELAFVVAPAVEEAPFVDAPATMTKKANPELTAEQRAIESKKGTDRRKPLEQRKRKAADNPQV